ncbi:MYB TRANSCRIPTION FACTOR [Salix koriyanagi]|uniref:MYB TRANSCRIPTION FACTOR n=1 Tax=Salix koriyanagi TaxID=2511006 RepID=A0A9Q1A528_9ROSI|nr:MYB TRANSCRIPTION FACTOR [Salix koriyanagi]
MIGTQGTRRQLFRDCKVKVSMNKSVQISKHSSIFPLHLCLSNFLPIFLNPKKTLISSQSLCKNPEKMSSMAATTGGRSFDSDITRWVIEFILRQLQTPVLTITKILTNRHVPLSNTSPRLKKSILLRQIDADIEDGSVSEKTLDAIETVEQIDRNEGDLIMDSMKNAYCAVAVECTVKYMLGNLQRARKGKFLEAVERVWKQRVGGLKREGRSELVTGKLMKCFEEMEVALKDDGVAKRWLKRNTRNEAVEMVRVYLGEAVAVSGPVFVEMVASMEMRGDGGLLCRKRGEGENEGVDVNLGGGEVNGLTEKSREGGGGENGVAGVNGGGGRVCVVRIVCYHEIQKNNMVRKHRHVVPIKRSKGPVKITNTETSSGDVASSLYDTITTDEVNKVRGKLIASSKELRARVKDPLPATLKQTENLMAEMARNLSNQENSNQSEADATNHFTNQPAVPSIRNEKGKGVDAPNLSANLSKEANAGVASCSHQNNVSKPSLMERNATARTFEWDDSIDDSSEGTGDQMNRIHLDRPKRRAVSPLTSEGTGDQMNRIHLDSPKRRAVSPLKKYELARIAKRRKPKRWSQEEEDALRESVKKYGKGNWKLIWNSRRSVFQERTEVDLKDKWRNMTRYG